MGELISGAEARIPEVEGCLDPANESSSPTASIFRRKIEFHTARKPFNGFSNAQRGDFKIETLNPGPDPKRLPGAGMVQASTGRKKVDGSDFLKAGLDPELSFRMTFRKIVSPCLVGDELVFANLFEKNFNFSGVSLD